MKTIIQKTFETQIKSALEKCYRDTLSRRIKDGMASAKAERQSNINYSKK